MCMCTNLLIDEITTVQRFIKLTVRKESRETKRNANCKPIHPPQGERQRREARGGEAQQVHNKHFM